MTRSYGKLFAVSMLLTAWLCFLPFYFMDRDIPPQPWTLYFVAVSFAFTAYTGSLIAGRLGVDWHGNPIGTMVMLARGKVNPLEALVHITSQLLGAAIALWLVWPQFGFENGEEVAPVPVPLPGIPWWVTMWSALAVGIGMALAYWLSDVNSGIIGKLAVPAMLGFCVFKGFPYEGGGANPARNVIPMLCSGKWDLRPSFWELLGAALIAAIAFAVTLRSQRRVTSQTTVRQSAVV